MSVCYHCTKRAAGCHSVCESYRQERKENEKRRRWEQQFRTVDSMPSTQTVYKSIYGKRKHGGKQ